MQKKVSSKISVVIPTRNRERDLEMCIKSLLKQTCPPHEIIVIDDCSSDNTPTICKKYNVKYVRNHTRMRQSHGKNVGIQKSTGQLVAFTDDDCAAQRAWLEELSKSLRSDENNGIVGGRIINVSERARAEKTEKSKIVRILIRFFYLRSGKTGRVYINGEGDINFDTCYEGEVDFVGSGNMLIDKAKIDVLFDEKLKGNCRLEEFDFCHRAKINNKIRVFYTPKAVVYHKASEKSRVDLFEDLYFRKRNRIYLLFKNRIPFSGVLNILTFALTQTTDVFAYMMLCIKDRRYFNAILGKRDGLVDYLKK